jgi:ribonuclease VapC
MIVDSSAIMAILLGEAEAHEFAAAMITATSCAISGGTWVELAAVAVRGGDALDAELEALMRKARIRIEPVSEQQARIGHQAYRDFGQGTGHPARLNFGDCFAYALSKATGEPLLFKGDDFVHTDVPRAV